GVAVAARRALEQFTRRGDGLAERGVGQRIDRALEIDLRGVRECARGIERGVAHLVEPIHRRGQDRPGLARQRRRAAEFPDRHVLRPPPRLLQCSILFFFLHCVKQRKAVLRSSLCATNLACNVTPMHALRICEERGPSPQCEPSGFSSDHSPVCSKEPCRRALSSSAMKPTTAATKSAAFKARASSIRSARNTWLISNSRMPSNT